MHRRYPVLMAAFTVLAMAAPALRPAAAYHKPEEVAAALQKRLHRVDRFVVQGGARLLAAGTITDPFRNQTRPSKVLQNVFWADSGVPGFGRMEFRLMIEGKGAVELVYDSLKGGYCRKEIKLE